MSAESVEPVTSGIDTREIAKVLDFIKAHEARRDAASALFLAGSDSDDRVELTDQLNDLLKQVVQALADGLSVNVLVNDQEISTQQAADILGLSRPTVVRLIEEGELPATVPGAVRRKLRLVDVLAYRDELYERRTSFIAESSEEFDDIDPEEASALIAEIREEHRPR
ncbi:MAG: excisionase family DNA-binding protein [Pseudonocardiaceae bacterium]